MRSRIGPYHAPLSPKASARPETIEWLSDNGSCYTATDTRRFEREICFLPLRTPIESPQSNGMAEAFVRTFKRDYVAFNPTPDAKTVIQSLPIWSEHYNPLHPHRALVSLSERVHRSQSIFNW